MGSTAGVSPAPGRLPWLLVVSLSVSFVVTARAWPTLDSASPSSSLDPNGDADTAGRGATGLATICACGADVSKCPAGRTAKTPNRCPPCGMVCARQTGEPCSVDEPCAKDFGLSCDPVSNTCKGTWKFSFLL
ncbi:hypothetical protein HPB48_016049 [Haemaphysalis longicornis]|uniref:IGFBP N-terminal domain-containing protein n=1 Tax=Haemaphysalis longicornis TaxID=44386 RepID=A0A9J6GKA1_HAELO|nr:hypothetical protein HPB48_016049 [Haemaphysalis longicornis]